MNAALYLEEEEPHWKAQLYRDTRHYLKEINRDIKGKWEVEDAHKRYKINERCVLLISAAKDRNILCLLRRSRSSSTLHHWYITPITFNELATNQPLVIKEFARFVSMPLSMQSSGLASVSRSSNHEAVAILAECH